MIKIKRCEIMSHDSAKYENLKEAREDRKLWEREPQTKIKHQLLKKYISPWMAILLQHQERYRSGGKLIYIDGFAGPGLYLRGSSSKAKVLGSPLIVANLAKKYIRNNSDRKISIICIDKDIKNVKHLNYYLSRFNVRYNQHWKAYHDRFDNSINNLLNMFESKGLTTPPMFFFIDPFGYSGFPISTLKRIMNYPKVELFINFMVYEITRRIGDHRFEKAMLGLFGTDEYKKALEIIDPEEKSLFLRNLYSRQIRIEAGVKHVMPFRINTPGQGTKVKYFLIHGSSNFKALELMKNSMAKISDNEYTYEAIGINSHQEDLFENPEKITLRDKLSNFVQSFGEVGILYDDLYKWAYKTTSGISKTIIGELLVLESKEAIIVKRKPRQLKNTVAKGARIIYKNT